MPITEIRETTTGVAQASPGCTADVDRSMRHEQWVDGIERQRQASAEMLHDKREPRYGKRKTRYDNHEKAGVRSVEGLPGPTTRRTLLRGRSRVTRELPIIHNEHCLQTITDIRETINEIRDRPLNRRGDHERRWSGSDETLQAEKGAGPVTGVDPDSGNRVPRTWRRKYRGTSQLGHDVLAANHPCANLGRLLADTGPDDKR